MNKKQIIGLALAVVLVSGFSFVAQAAPVLDTDGAGNSVTASRVIKSDMGDLEIVLPHNKDIVEPYSYNRNNQGGPY